MAADFGSPIGARLAIRALERIVALVIQNGDVPYEDALGPKYADIEASWNFPEAKMREMIGDSVNIDTFREEFLNALRPELARCIPPDLAIALVIDDGET